MFEETRNLARCVELQVNYFGAQSLFWTGLAIRLILIILIEPVYAVFYYVPFMETAGFTLTPWSAWLTSGGSIEAFPYGYVMWLALLPAASILTFLDLPVVYGYLVTLLIADFCLLITLRISMPERLFACSILVFASCHACDLWHGFE